jgi:CheY-like chemotaxis protein
MTKSFAEGQRSCSEDTNRRRLHEAVEARQQRPAATAWEPRSLRVLVIEDDRDAAESMAQLVRLWGHDVRQANSAQAGLEEAFAYRPDFVLLDIAMPIMDGYALARQLRLHSRLQGCFIVAITGYGDDEQRRRSYESGINLFLVKPVDPIVLEKLLQLEGDYLNRAPDSGIAN